MVDDLAARFTERRIPHPEWTHAAHLAVGAWHVRRFGPEEALARLRLGIRRLNESHGTPNTSAKGYHETITRAYVQLLAEFLRGFSDDVSIDQVVQELLAGPLVKREALSAFFSRDVLSSAAARTRWVDPDLAPVSFARLVRNP